MKDKNGISLMALPITLGIALLICAVIRTMVPMAILPKLDIPNMVLLSLMALLIQHYLGKNSDVPVIAALLLSGLTFSLLPVAMGFVLPAQMGKLAIVGGVVYTATAWIYGELLEWLSSGSGCKAGPVLGALGLYLASQCLSGMIL